MNGKNLITIVKTQMKTIQSIIDKSINQTNIIVDILGTDYFGWEIYVSLSNMNNILYINIYNYYNDSKCNDTQHCGSLYYKNNTLYFLQMIPNMYCGSPMPIEAIYELEQGKITCCNALVKNQIILDYDTLDIVNEFIIPQHNRYNVEYLQCHRKDTPKSMLSVAFMFLEENISYFQNLVEKNNQINEKWLEL